MGRAPCCDKNGLKKGPWTPEEDAKLTSYIQTHGPGNWRTLPKNAGLQRCGKSCRLRWTNYLRPDIKRGRFSFEEEETIIQLHSILGNKWSAIAARLPGRTDNEIKNYWNTHIRKRLLRSGIDPVTHAPRLDLLDLSSLLTSSLCNPSLLNVSNLLRTQALMNPEILRLASTLLSLKNSESIQENLFPPNTNLQNTANAQLLVNQLQSQIQQLQQQVPSASVMNQTQPNNVNVDNNVVSSNMTNLACPIPQENFAATSSALEDHQFVSQQPNYVECNDDASNPMASVNGLLESLNYQLMNNNNNNSCTDQNIGGFDSVLSTPLSSPNHPLNSSSTFINSSTEDERDSYCSNLFQFQIPESLDLGDFM